MEKRQVVLWLLVPANEQTAETIHPGVRPLHDPPACFEAGHLFDCFGLFPTRAHMSGEAKLLQNFIYLIIVIAGIKTHSSLAFCRWLWPLNHYTLDGRARQFHVMPV